MGDSNIPQSEGVRIVFTAATSVPTNAVVALTIGIDDGTTTISTTAAVMRAHRATMNGDRRKPISFLLVLTYAHTNRTPHGGHRVRASSPIGEGELPPTEEIREWSRAA